MILSVLQHSSPIHSPFTHLHWLQPLLLLTSVALQPFLSTFPAHSVSTASFQDIYINLQSYHSPSSAPSLRISINPPQHSSASDSNMNSVPLPNLPPTARGPHPTGPTPPRPRHHEPDPDLDLDPDPNPEGITSQGNYPAHKFAGPYQPPFLQFWASDELSQYQYLNCSFFSHPSDEAPTLLQLKQHAQALVNLIKTIDISMREPPKDRDSANSNNPAGITDADLDASDAFDYLEDLSKVYQNSSPSHNTPLYSVRNNLRTTGVSGSANPFSRNEKCAILADFKAFLDERHDEQAEYEPSTPTPAQRRQHGKPGQPQPHGHHRHTSSSDPRPFHDRPREALHNYIRHASSVLECLDELYAEQGGIFALVPPPGSANRELIKQSFLGQWLVFTTALVQRVAELEAEVRNSRDVLAGEALAPRRLLGTVLGEFGLGSHPGSDSTLLGGGGGGGGAYNVGGGGIGGGEDHWTAPGGTTPGTNGWGTPLVFPQDRYVLANLSAGLWETLSHELDHKMMMQVEQERRAARVLRGGPNVSGTGGPGVSGAGTGATGGGGDVEMLDDDDNGMEQGTSHPHRPIVWVDVPCRLYRVTGAPTIFITPGHGMDENTFWTKSEEARPLVQTVPRGALPASVDTAEEEEGQEQEGQGQGQQGAGQPGAGAAGGGTAGGAREEQGQAPTQKQFQVQQKAAAATATNAAATTTAATTTPVAAVTPAAATVGGSGSGNAVGVGGGSGQTNFNPNNYKALLQEGMARQKARLDKIHAARATRPAGPTLAPPQVHPVHPVHTVTTAPIASVAGPAQVHPAQAQDPPAVVQLDFFTGRPTTAAVTSGVTTTTTTTAHPDPPVQPTQSTQRVQLDQTAGAAEDAEAAEAAQLARVYQLAAQITVPPTIPLPQLQPAQPAQPPAITPTPTPTMTTTTTTSEPPPSTIPTNPTKLPPSNNPPAGPAGPAPSSPSPSRSPAPAHTGHRASTLPPYLQSPPSSPPPYSPTKTIPTTPHTPTTPYNLNPTNEPPLKFDYKNPFTPRTAALTGNPFFASGSLGPRGSTHTSLIRKEDRGAARLRRSQRARTPQERDEEGREDAVLNYGSAGDKDRLLADTLVRNRRMTARMRRAMGGMDLDPKSHDGRGGPDSAGDDNDNDTLENVENVENVDTSSLDRNGKEKAKGKRKADGTVEGTGTGDEKAGQRETGEREGEQRGKGGETRGKKRGLGKIGRGRLDLPIRLTVISEEDERERQLHETEIEKEEDKILRRGTKTMKDKMLTTALTRNRQLKGEMRSLDAYKHDDQLFRRKKVKA
ncbi:hypothetical protein L228DRAFT_282045 [Xylona heveae TC161]|uniref:Uncharacterized protein n=1 Tax=Xylona heveae (strain CBS 132557 / TC161) TaxID=1328760 RepID=A0A161TC36_XYLHT|nr:hypothetical protein L228DRAFT_282045 [Xylona heveae TC161]KZF23307.1 hypothetical protein L228DRAFT_282045 [Xylona heveae TC161]